MLSDERIKQYLNRVTQRGSNANRSAYGFNYGYRQALNDVAREQEHATAKEILEEIEAYREWPQVCVDCVYLADCPAEIFGNRCTWWQQLKQKYGVK